jgi:RNA recognition motif-containing protein
MGRKLYVGNLPFSSTDHDLFSIFSEHGRVMSARIVTDRETGRSKGFAFVEMSSDEEAVRAAEQMNGKSFLGRSLTVNEARPREFDSSRSRVHRMEGSYRF